MALTVMTAAGLPAGVAHADDTGLYIGGSLGRSDERFEPSAYNVRADKVGYQVAAGWRPIDLLAGEVDYVGFGRAQGGINYAGTDGVGAGMHWSSLGARLEYERYEISATSAMSLASVGMTWTFL